MFLITGGGSGIGSALALALAQRGESVLIIGRREGRLQNTAKGSHQMDYLCADVSTMEGLDAIYQRVKDIPISGLVNNAGTLEPILPLIEMQPKEWQHAFNTNLNAALFLPQKLLNQLQNARVLNIGSAVAYFPIKGWAAYCCSKAALAMLTRCWQMESDSIAFASVMPGIIDTDMQHLARTDANMDPDQVRFYKRLKDQQLLISPETVATFLTWLLLDVEPHQFTAQEWDIYDTSHHSSWLKPPQQVLHWDF